MPLKKKKAKASRGKKVRWRGPQRHDEATLVDTVKVSHNHDRDMAIVTVEEYGKRVKYLVRLENLSLPP